MTKHISRVSIFGVPFSKMGMDETVGYLAESIEAGRSMHVVTANSIMVMASLDNPELARAMDAADLIVPDGSGIVWAARYCGDPVAERVGGFDLMHRLLEVGEKRRWSVYLLGSTEEIIQAAADNLQLQYPQVRVVGFRNGFFNADQDEEIIEEIRPLKPDLLFVARGMDKEGWNADYKDRLDARFIMGVGGSFDIVAGALKRAPVIFQKLGMEWFYRLLQEPSRYKRMLVLPKFVLKVVRDKENVTKPRLNRPK